MFKRRRGSLHLDQLREYVAPRKGFLRGLRYIGIRLRRLSGSPHAIALGFAFGVFASFTPFFGFHILIGIGLAALFRVPILAAALGTVVGNPITFPIIAATSIRNGKFLLGINFEPGDDRVPPAQDLLLELPSIFDSIFLPYLLGGTVLGLVTGTLAYIGIRSAVIAYRVARRRVKKTAKTPKGHP